MARYDGEPSNGYYNVALPPLPDEEYPRQFPKKTRNLAYWFVRLVILGVESIMPLAFVYLAWFICTYPRALSLPHTLLLHLAAVWAATEVWFVFYYAQMTRDIQPVSPATDMKHDQLSDLFLRVLHAGLRVNAPLSRSRAYSAPGAWPEVRASVESILQAIAEGHHPADATGAEDTKVESEVKAAFGVTSVPDSVTAEAAARAVKAARRRMTRLDSTAAQMPYEEDPDPLFDDDGRPRVLSSDDPRAIEFREQLRTWFYHAPWEKIHAQDVQHWLAWSAFSMPLDEVRKNPKKARFLDRTFTMLEARTGTKFPPGRSGVKVVLLTLDPIRTRHRPLFIYVLTNTVNWFIRRIYYPHRGGIVYREGDIDYIVRIPPGWTPEKGRTEPNAMPVVYLHGLGYGLLQNHMLIKHLVASLPTHPLLIPIAHHTAQGLFDHRYLKPWKRQEFVGTIKDACKRWGFWSPEEGGGVSMLSHSNGSVHHGWIVKDCPQMIKRNTFVDPVVFCLWEGDVCFNFCYRIPTTWLELLLEFFVATEVGIANYIHRHFVWSDNTLFVDEIPNADDPTKTAIFLGGKDIIIDAARTRRYLERNGIRRGLHWDAHAGHGDGLLGGSRDRVVMYVGTGSTKGWEGWLTRGRRSHSLGELQRPKLPAVYSGDSSSSGGFETEKTPRW